MPVTCMCSPNRPSGRDPRCFVHPNHETCRQEGQQVLRYFDGPQRFLMCHECADEALASGLFARPQRLRETDPPRYGRHNNAIC